MNEIRKLRRELSNNQRQGLFVLAGSALFISSVLALGQNMTGMQLFNLPVVSWVLAGVGTILLWMGLKK